MKNLFGKAVSWVRRNRSEAALIAILLIISVTAHAWNMFGYPYYENDEATYISRAWTFATEGRLDVYTYRYDHAPLGWMLIGLWLLLTGGASLFGSFLVSGRVMMLAVHIISTVLMYVLAKRFSKGSRVAGAVAVLMLSLSPLAIYFQRRILLDNLMVMWLLVSLFLVTSPRRRLKHFIWSGAMFGVAVLTKLNAVFFGPAFLYIIWRRASKANRVHAAGYWLAMGGIVLASFFLFALLKGELFAAPLGSDGQPLRVSVVDTFALQLGRGDFAWPWDPQSSFVQNVNSWLLKDWFILVIGAASTLFITITGALNWKKQPYILAAASLVWFYLLFLARGKIVIDLYVVPVLPFLALATGLAVYTVHERFVKAAPLKQIFLAGTLLILSLMFAVQLSAKQYTDNEVSNQLKAADWVVANVPKDAIIAADNYVYPILAQQNGFTNVSYFFSTEYDPELRELYNDDWRNVEYMVVTHEVMKQIKAGTVPKMRNAFDHATLVADFRTNASSFIDLKNYISTNGDWAQVYRIKSRNDIVLQDSWKHFKTRFIYDYGQVVDLTNNEMTTSTDQALAMRRAIEANDEQMFRGLWQWSKDHLRYRATDSMLSWQWKKQPDGTYMLGDSNTVCDADQQLAYALYKANDLWRDDMYLDDANSLLGDWWRECVFERNGRLYIDSSADGSQDIRLVNTGYFNPEHYRYFATVRPEFAWSKLIDDNYIFLNELLVKYGTIPNWQVVQVDGTLTSAVPLIGTGADAFGYDAMQLVPRLYYDYQAARDARAQTLLAKLDTPLHEFVVREDNQTAKAVYLMYLQATDAVAHREEIDHLYAEAIYGVYNAAEGSWSDGYNYRDHIWLWQWHSLQNKLPPEARASLK